MSMSVKQGLTNATGMPTVPTLLVPTPARASLASQETVHSALVSGCIKTKKHIDALQQWDSLDLGL